MKDESKVVWVYVASPCFSIQDRQFANNIEEALCQMAIKGVTVKCYVPHRDGGDWAESGKNKVFVKDMEALRKCKIIVANLDGADIDSGVCGELGIAYAYEMVSIGICTDIDRRRKEINAFIEGLLTQKGIARNLHQLKMLVGEAITNPRKPLWA